MEKSKIYVEKKQFTTQSGEIKEYNTYYIYCDNKYDIPSLKVSISLEKEVVNLLHSMGAIYEEEK